MFHHSLGGIDGHLATVRSSGQVFHIITSSSKEPFPGIVASRPLYNRAHPNVFRTC